MNTMNSLAADITPVMSTINKGQPDGWNIPTTSNISQILAGGAKFNVITFAFVLVGFYFMFNIISAGFEYVMSTGDPKKIAGATSRFMNGFIGIVIVLSAFMIVNLITSMIGLGSLL